MVEMGAIPGKSAFVNSDLSLLLRSITSGGSSTINYATALAPPIDYFSAQVGRLDRVFFHENTLTIMVKIIDELSGKIGPRWLNKSLTEQDKQKFEQGCSIAEASDLPPSYTLSPINATLPLLDKT